MNYLPRWVLEKIKPDPIAVPKEEEDISVQWDGNCKYVLKTDDEIAAVNKKKRKVKLPNGLVIYSTWYKVSKEND